MVWPFPISVPLQNQVSRVPAANESVQLMKTTDLTLSKVILGLMERVQAQGCSAVFAAISWLLPCLPEGSSVLSRDFS
jgi:hypothetical protein